MSWLHCHIGCVVQTSNWAGRTLGTLNWAEHPGTQFPKFPETHTDGEAALGRDSPLAPGSEGNRNFWSRILGLKPASVRHCHPDPHPCRRD